MSFNLDNWAVEEFWPKDVAVEFVTDIAAGRASGAERSMITGIVTQYIELAISDGHISVSNGQVRAVPLIEWAISTLGLFVPRETFEALCAENPARFTPSFIEDYRDRLDQASG